MAERLDRLEAIEAIRQLVYGYALAVDARDLDAIVALYVDDVRVAEGRSGRDALRATFDASLRQFTASAHHVTNHLIEFLETDDATGLVGCRVEHEVGDKRSEEHTSELQSLMRISYAVFCLKKQ